MRARTRMLWRDLWRLRGQAIAASIVVACGIAAFVAMQTTSHSLAASRDAYYRAMRFADVFAELERAPIGVAAALASVPGVAAVDARVTALVTLDVPGLPEPASARLVSVPDRGPPALNGLALTAGRLPEPGRDDEAVASRTFAEANGLRVGDTVGAIIEGRWKRLRLVGLALSPEFVYEVGPGMLFPDNRRYGVLWMGQTALAAAFGMQGAFDAVSLSLERGASRADVMAAVDRLLERWGGRDAFGRDEHPSDRFIEDELGELRVIATYIPAVFLGVAAFLLYLALARLVAMQRAQIGLLKAFGYRGRTVAAHYLQLALASVAPGLAIGLVAGTWLGARTVRLYAAYFHFPALTYEAPAALLAAAVGLALAAGTIGALGAVRRTLALAPAEAMRPEAPPAYRPGLLERAGLARRLPASLRMILRGIARRPWKSALSVLGMALAVATMVLARFGVDAPGRLMQVQFDEVLRADLTVMLHRPADARAAHALARLPGVLAIEPFREVPVRLRAGHRSKRVSLAGRDQGGELSRLLDARLRPVQLPPAGLVLGDKLARLLGVRPGDRVQVEVLEGRRRRVEVPVAALTDELLGLGAYMDRRALAPLLGEGRTLSGAWLRTDPALAPALYATLKRTPAVAGVSVRAALRDSVRQTMDRSFLVMTTIVVGFSALLVGGVVYNGARIALSERGNELASLRVLGFSRREAVALLLGEQALLAAAAAPLGCVLGLGLAAMLVPLYDRELFRLPLVIEPRSYAYALATLAAAAAASGLLVARRVRGLDLIAVLKTRE